MLSVLVLLMDLSGALGTSLRSETRLESPGTDGSDLALVLETAPQLELTLASRRASMDLTYTPRLTLLDTSREVTRPYLLQEGAASFGWRSRHAALVLGQRASYGDSNVARLTAGRTGDDGAAAPLQLVPASGVLPILSSSTTLAAQVDHRRWTVRSSLGYELDGGADREARRVLPLRFGPGATAGLEYSLRRGTRTVTLVSASRVTFSSGADNGLFTVEQGIRHHTSSVSEAELSLGVSGTEARTREGGAGARQLHPSGRVGWTHQTPGLGGRSELRFALRQTPVVNRLLGTVDERLEASFALRRERGPLETTVSLGASQSVPMTAPTAARLFAAEVAQSYDVSRALRVTGGLRSSWQRPQAAAAGSMQAALFFSLTLRAPRAEL